MVPDGIVRLKGLTRAARDRASTSDVVANAGAEAAPPGDEVPVEDLPVDAAGLHSDD